MSEIYAPKGFFYAFVVAKRTFILVNLAAVRNVTEHPRSVGGCAINLLDGTVLEVGNSFSDITYAMSLAPTGDACIGARRPTGNY